MNVHPEFQDTLHSFSSLSSEIAQMRLEVYLKALKEHDWDFKECWHTRYWANGRAELAFITAMRKEVDPDGTLWNTYAPLGHQVSR